MEIYGNNIFLVLLVLPEIEHRYEVQYVINHFDVNHVNQKCLLGKLVT